MDGVGKPTHITIEPDADVVIRKGTATVELRADGSIYVNGSKVAEIESNVKDKPVSPAVVAPEPETARQTEVVPQPEPAKVEVDPAVRRKELIKQAMQAGKSGAELMQYVEEMLQQETMQRDSGIKPTGDTTPTVTPPVMPRPVAEQPVQEETQVPPQPATGPQIGQTVGDKGVFIGTWEPRDKKGKSLGKVFNVYAAPEDLKDDDDEKLMLTFNDAAKRVASLKDFHGHDGGDYASDDALLKALRKDTYNGEWFIPPLEIMATKDPAGEFNKLGILTVARNTGDLADTFEKVAGVPTSQMYWTSTETASDPDYVQYVDVSDDRGARKLVNYMGRDLNKLATRLVRLELRS